MSTISKLVGFILKTKNRLIIGWLVSWGFFAGLLALMYEDLKDTADEIEELINAYPEGLLEAFNYTENTFTSFQNILSSEFFTMYSIAAGITMMIQANNYIQKKIETGEIVFFLTQNIKRSEYIIGGILANIFVNVLLHTSLAAILFLISNLISSQLEFGYLAEMVVNFSMLGVTFYAIGLAFSANNYMNFSNLQLILLVFVFWMFEIASKLAESFEWFKYLTPFEFATLLGNERSVASLWLMLPIFTFTALTIYLFNNRDIQS